MLLILVTGGAILTVVLVAAYQAVASLSQSLIERTADRTEVELQRFFEPVTRNLLVARDWGAGAVLSVNDTRALNAIFIPTLTRYPQVSSMMIADSTGLEYMLLQSEEDWLNRRMDVDRLGTRAHWMRWRDATEQLDDWWQELDYDPRRRPWYQGAMEGAQPEMHWTEPYTFFTTKDPGITASIRWQPDADANRTYVLAFDIMLTAISEFTTAIEVGERGKTFVLTDDHDVLGLPRHERFATPESLRSAVLLPAQALGIDEISDGLRAWREGESLTETPIKYRSGGEAWWAGFRRFPLGPNRGLWIGVAVPQADLLGDTAQQRNGIIAITLVALAVGILIATLMDRAYQRRIRSEVQRAKQLGQYTLENKLGEGGMGAVYRAKHAMLRRPTAIKLMRPDQERNPQALARFEREVQLTSSLTHANTIAIYDYGRTPEGVFYYAMEYLAGVTLQDLVERTGPVSAARVIYVLRQVCGSLAEAHDIGLIHRDIKPGNIMLCERGGTHDFVKVLDFGLVKDVQATADAGLTAQEMIVGTPSYLAPESVNQPETMDGRSDLYLVGAVGFFLLTGRDVFIGRNVVEIMAHHVGVEPDPPSSIVAGIPDDIEAIILRCLAKSPEDRYANAVALSEALAACADAGGWDADVARQWWAEHGDAARAADAATVEATGSQSVLDIDLAARST